MYGSAAPLKVSKIGCVPKLRDRDDALGFKVPEVSAGDETVPTLVGQTPPRVKKAPLGLHATIPSPGTSVPNTAALAGLAQRQ